MPSVITSLTSAFQSVPDAGGSAATAPAARITRPPSECPTSAIRVTGTGHASTSRCISAARATPFSRSGRPVLARRKTGVQPRSASASPYVVPVRSRCRFQ